MSRSRTNFPLLQLRSWLISGSGASVSEKTAEVYLSLLRGFLKSEEVAKLMIEDSGKFRELALAHDLGLRSNTRHSFRAAIRVFLRFLKEQSGTEILVDFTDARLHRGREWKEHPIAKPLRAIMTERFVIKPQHIEPVKWCDVRRSQTAPKERAELYVKLANTVYEVPIAPLRELGLWAGGGKPPEGRYPLIPILPGSLFPMAWRQIKKILDGEPMVPPRLFSP